MLFSCVGWMVMSNAGTDNKTQRIIDAVTEVWKLPDRDDLLNDCINYVANNYSHSYEIKDLVIEFLSMKCADVISEADVDAMAIEDQERKATTYDEATQGL
jgi:arginine/lysine/ornithine decarboxylase